MKTDTRREQCCDYCGEPIGVFMRLAGDGPLDCGQSECSRWAREEYLAMREDARFRAEQDDYGRYR